jgi:hypothetical protein
MYVYLNSILHLEIKHIKPLGSDQYTSNIANYTGPTIEKPEGECAQKR